MTFVRELSAKSGHLDAKMSDGRWTLKKLLDRGVRGWMKDDWQSDKSVDGSCFHYPSGVLGGWEARSRYPIRYKIVLAEGPCSGNRWVRVGMWYVVWVERKTKWMTATDDTRLFYPFKRSLMRNFSEASHWTF